MHKEWFAGYYAFWDGAEYSWDMPVRWQAGWLTASYEIDWGIYIELVVLNNRTITPIFYTVQRS